MGYETRVRAMASYIVPYGGVTRVLDLGCGDHCLRKYLHGYTQYYPVDKVQFKTPCGINTVCDLNENPKLVLQLGRVHYAFCSGILEYITDIEEFMKIISIAADNVILSYNTTTVQDLKQGARSSRLDQGWVNDFTMEDLIYILRSAHYEIDTVAFVIPGREQEVIITASHPGVWRKSVAPKCAMRVPVEEWRFMSDPESWEVFRRNDPGAKE